jgi:hypothetical protein
LVACASILSSLACTAAQSAQENVSVDAVHTSISTPADTYKEIYRVAVDRYIEQARQGNEKKKGYISVACYAWILAEQTTTARYKSFALALYDLFLAEEIDHDFHTSRPFGLLTWKMHQAGALTGSRCQNALQQARRRIDWFLDDRNIPDEFFDCNISLADTLAVACLARTFAGEPGIRASEVRLAVSRLGKRIFEVGDLNEDAANYSSLGICFFLELAQLQGWTDEIRNSKSLHRMFVRQREIISPAGQIPEFGDSYFQFNRRRLGFASLLEVAARLYDDSAFLEVIPKVVPPDTRYMEDDQLFRGYLLLTLPPYKTTKAAEMPDPSMVLYRNIPEKPILTVPDKLILRTGRQPGDAMIMIDLYSEGSHAHRFKRPSIGYYEAAGVPLFHNLGRRGTRSAQCGNSFWTWDNPQTFPGYPKPNQWNTMTVPATYCFEAEEKGSYRISRDVLFRNRTGDLKTLRLDNLRLTGPAGTRLLDGFESPHSWHQNISQQPGVELVSSSDRTQGRYSQQVNWGVLGSGFRTRLFEQEQLRNTSFRLSDYDSLKLDYKYDGSHPRCNLRTLFRPGRWINLGNRVLDCGIERAEARQLGRDAWGSVDFSSYNGPGNDLKRRLVLTEEGVLVVVDTFVPGPETDGWAGGQLWQLYALDQRGDDWFASKSDGPYTLTDGSTSQRRMLVKYMKGPGVNVAMERVQPATMHALRADGTRHNEFYTTFSKAALQRGRKTVAAMVVLPLKADENPSQAAGAIRFEPRQQRKLVVSITLRRRGRRLTLHIEDDRVVVEHSTLSDDSIPQENDYK